MLLFRFYVVVFLWIMYVCLEIQLHKSIFSLWPLKINFICVVPLPIVIDHYALNSLDIIHCRTRIRDIWTMLFRERLLLGISRTTWPFLINIGLRCQLGKRITDLQPLWRWCHIYTHLLTLAATYTINIPPSPLKL